MRRLHDQTEARRGRNDGSAPDLGRPAQQCTPAGGQRPACHDLWHSWVSSVITPAEKCEPATG